MKINFSALFQTSLEKARFILLFGNDKVIFERALTFLQKEHKAFLDFKTENDLLSSPVPQPSLFEAPTQKPIPVISSVTDKILPYLDSLPENIYIFISDKARAQSKLVTHFTQNPSCLAVACYASPLVPREFEVLTKGLALPPAFQRILFETYQNDYMGLLAALEKIKLYGEVPEDQAEGFLQKATFSDDFSGLIHAFLLKERARATSLLRTLALADVVSFLRSVSRAFQTLWVLTSYQNNQTPIPWQSLTPPVFFKEKPFYEAALKRWKKVEVKAFLETLLLCEEKHKMSHLTGPDFRHKLLFFLSR